MEQFLALFVALVIAGAIVAVVFWGIAAIPVPEPFAMILRAVVVVAVVIYLVGLLAGYIPHSTLFYRR